MSGVKRPILYIVLPFCAGIALSHFFNLPISLFVISTALFLALAVISFRNNVLSHILLYIALVFFGAAYHQNYNILSPDHIANFAGDSTDKVLIRGVVVDDPSVKKAFYGKEKITFTIKAAAVRLLRPAFGGTRNDGEEGASHDDGNWQSTSGRVKTDLYLSHKSRLPEFGDEVIIKGRLEKPAGLKNPGTFDYPDYLKIMNIYAVLAGDEVRIVRDSPNQPVSIQRMAYALRHRVRDAISRHVERPYSGFLTAILVGDRSDLDNSITDDFVQTGTVHVIAISGLNIAFVAGIFIFVFKLFGFRKSLNLVLASIAVIFYCLAAGSSPPVLRATIIFTIAVLGYMMNRENDILNSLSAAAFLILLWNPKELFDPSFQLSFVSVASIILFQPKIEGLFGEKPNYLIKGAAVSIAATIGVFPIVAKYFNIVSPIAILANLIVVPALFVMTVVSFIFLFFSLLSIGPLAAYLGLALSLLSRLVFYINQVLAKVPFAYIRIGAPSAALIALYYSAVFVIFFARDKKKFLIPLLLAATVIIWSGQFDSERSSIRMTFLDVGKGDSSLVQFPDRGTMLIDGGSGGIDASWDMGKAVVAPYLWNSGIKRLDAVVATHFHEDHLGGLIFILNNFDVGCVIDNGAVLEKERSLYDEYLETIKRRRIRRIIAGAGDEITGFGKARIHVMNPIKGSLTGDPNDDSLVLKINYGNFSAIFCGDISEKAMSRMLQYGDMLKSDVIKIPHHGGSIGEGSAIIKFFEYVDSDVSIISSGGRQDIFKASKRTREMLDNLGCVNYETNSNGAIKITSDGINFKHKPFCQKN